MVLMTFDICLYKKGARFCYGSPVKPRTIFLTRHGYLLEFQQQFTDNMAKRYTSDIPTIPAVVPVVSHNKDTAFRDNNFFTYLYNKPVAL